MVAGGTAVVGGADDTEKWEDGGGLEELDVGIEFAPEVVCAEDCEVLEPDVEGNSTEDDGSDMADDGAYMPLLPNMTSSGDAVRSRSRSRSAGIAESMSRPLTTWDSVFGKSAGRPSCQRRCGGNIPCQSFSWRAVCCIAAGSDNENDGDVAEL